MDSVEPKRCSECGGPLEDVVYGGECGPHPLSSFRKVPGYVIDVGDMYGDWDTPSTFVVPADKVGRVRDVWATDVGCCHYPSQPMWDDHDYCAKCGDCMEPAV